MSVVFPVPGFPCTHVNIPGCAKTVSFISEFLIGRKRSMSSESGDDDESLTRQILSLVWENNAFIPYVGVWLLYNVIVLALLIYIAIRTGA
jgi:hypothetical protein